VVRHPLTDSPQDAEVAKVETFAIRQANCWNNTWWMDPIFFGHYPEDGLKLFGKAAPKVKPGDMELIKQKVDFFGTNIYHSVPVKLGANGMPEYPAWPLDTQTTAFRWPVTPQALYWGPKFFYERYKLPIYITENGMSNNDVVSLDGQVHDPQRIDFLQRYLRELKRAIADGVDVRGYFQWSIMDNFEWAEGYKERFGLVHVNYVTQQRILKDSARWYTGVIESNGAQI
jgi:beta-glucosidase